MKNENSDSLLKQYVKEVWHSGRNLASAIGVSPITIYKNCKNARGAYKLIGMLYQEIKELKESNILLNESYAALSNRYAEISMTKSDDKVKEYLKK